MKKHIFTAVLALTLSFSATGLRAAGSNPEGAAAKAPATYYINAPRFVRPLVERLIGEYKQVNPQARLAIAKTADTRKNSQVTITLHDNSREQSAGKTVYFAQYAIVPITAANSEAYRLFDKKALGAKELKRLFFVGDDIDEAEQADKATSQVVVYAGGSSTSVAAPYVSYYGEPRANYRGKRIAGDDVYLNAAIAKDPRGITVNALPNIYDLDSRRLKSGLAVLPLDISKEARASLSTLDNAIAALEDGAIKGVAVTKIGFSYAHNAELDDFVSWVLSAGTAYNHQYGLLRLGDRDVSQESGKVNALTAHHTISLVQ